MNILNCAIKLRPVITPRILLFEDETHIAENLKYALKTQGHHCDHPATGQDGPQKLTARRYDLILLDVGLPDKNGFDLCKEIRAHSQIPIFFLSARAEEIDKVLGLELCADDDITNPFSPREVIVRMRTLCM